MNKRSDSKTVLVTGGAGYIGAHVCKALATAGMEPVVYDDFSQGKLESVRWGPFESGNILDSNRLDQVCKKYRPFSVMHFAALASVEESMIDPGRYWHNNVSGTLTLLESMRANSIQRMVFSSSCAVFGAPLVEAISESTPKRPVNPYGHTKLVTEYALRDCFNAYGINSVSLRYFNAAGADEDGEIGEEHEPETHLIPLTLKSVLSSGQPVTIRGTDYLTPDGTCVRDFIHVSDLAVAHLRALEYLQINPGEHQFNLGNGTGFSVRQVIDAVAKVTGRRPNVVLGERRPGDPAKLVADSRAAMKKLKWKPRYTDIEAIVDSAWNWFKHQ